MHTKLKSAILMGTGILAGIMLTSGAHAAVEQITAARSGCAVYIDGQRTELTAYLIDSENYVRLRDIGAAVDFNVYWERALFLDNLRGNTQ